MILDSITAKSTDAVDHLLTNLAAGEQQVSEAGWGLSERCSQASESDLLRDLSAQAAINRDRLEQLLPERLQGPWELDKAIWGQLRQLEAVVGDGAPGGLHGRIVLQHLLRLVGYQATNYSVAAAVIESAPAPPRPRLRETIDRIARIKERSFNRIRSCLLEPTPSFDHSDRHRAPRGGGNGDRMGPSDA